MAMMTCPDCNNSISDAAANCPNCGRPNAAVVSTQAKRSVGLLLGLGILLMPLVFAWFTLRKGHSVAARIIAFAWLAVSLLLVFGTGNPSKNVASNSAPAPSSVVPVQQQKTAQASAQAPAVLQMDIRKLLADYSNNEVGADNKYKGKQVQVTGTVTDVKKDIIDNLYVTLGTGKQFEIPELQAYFDDSMNSHLGDLNKGQKLTVICQIDGLMMNVLGKDCVIK